MPTTACDVAKPMAEDVNKIVHDRLNRAATMQSTSTVNDLLPAVIAQMDAVFATVSLDDMLAFAGSDRVLFNYGVAMIIVAIRRPETSSGRAVTPLVGVKLGTDEYAWAKPTAVLQLTDAMAEAEDFLRSIPAFSAEWDTVSEQPVFLGASRRKAARASLAITADRPLYSLFADDRLAWDWGHRVPVEA